MTIKELKETLKIYNDELEVVIDIKDKRELCAIKDIKALDYTGDSLSLYLICEEEG